MYNVTVEEKALMAQPLTRDEARAIMTSLKAFEKDGGNRARDWETKKLGLPCPAKKFAQLRFPKCTGPFKRLESHERYLLHQALTELVGKLFFTPDTYCTSPASVFYRRLKEHAN